MIKMDPKQKNKALFLFLIFIVIILNYITGVIANILELPFFMDTWATILGVAVGGLWVGLIGGTLYNLLMSLTIWPSAYWVWAISNIWIALISYYLIKKDMIDINKPMKVLMSGIIIGISSGILATIINLIFFGGLPTYAGTEPTYNAIYSLTKNAMIATFSEYMISELGDKIVSVFIAAIVINSFPSKLRVKKNG